MKKILISLGVVGVVAAIGIGVTVALFSDTETSSGNIFTAGSIDLKVDHTLATYNGERCVSNCVETGNNLVTNGSFETPDVPTGGWAVYPDGSLTSWNVESGAGLEIQDHAAGNPHGGNQLAELDSNNSSAISQVITTVAGGKYRLTLWYSPRINRPAGDNTIGAIVKVVSDNTVLVNDIIGAGSAGGPTTVWQKLTYDFVAVDTNTKVIFSDLGTSNSYGGSLDDISVKALNCTSTFPSGGTCALWGEKNLGVGDTFWTFDDIKPGDHGTNVISLHVDSNDAYVCLLSNNVQDLENGVVEAEGNDTEPDGELSDYMELFIWNDQDGDGQYEPTGEANLYEGDFIPTEMTQLSLPAGGTDNLGVAWCVGNQTVDNLTGASSCDGSGNQNNAQTDKLLADLVLYAVQQRNNSGFSCAGVTLPGEGQAQGPEPVGLGTAGDFAILSYAGITDVHPSAITGNVGASPITGAEIHVSCTEMTGTGKVYDDDAAYTGGFDSNTTCRVTDATLLGTAMGDLTIAYNDALSRATDVLNPGSAGEIGGLTLAPGVYTFSEASINVGISTNLTLNGGANDVWIFQIPGTFDVHANVILGGNAQAKNIFWVVAGATTIFPNTIVNGNILDHTSIAMQNEAVLNGRALSQTASVTLIANTVTKP